MSLIIDRFHVAVFKRLGLFVFARQGRFLSENGAGRAKRKGEQEQQCEPGKQNMTREQGIAFPKIAGGNRSI